jgi:DNA-directed RNA polymerase subunit RPC12/RpoP
MSFLEQAGNLINRGVASAGRGARQMTLRAQIGDLESRREKQMAQLGSMLYAQYSQDSAFRLQHEPLISAIEAINQQIGALTDEMIALENQAHVGETATSGIVCPNCRSVNPEGNAFCMNCGAKLVEQAEVIETTATFCSQCNTEIPAGSQFCPGCGHKVAAA